MRKKCYHFPPRPNPLPQRGRGKKGEGAFTLIEVMIAIVIWSVLMVGVVSLYRIVLLSWHSNQKREAVAINLGRGTEETVRDMREAQQVQSSNDEIRFTKDLASFFIYYLYNANDTYPPSFNQSSYSLRKTTLTGGINGTFTYGSGQIIALSILPPPTSDLSFASSMITLDLSAKRSDETIRLRTRVRPRNL